MSNHTPGPWNAEEWINKDLDYSGWSFSAGGCKLPLCTMETNDPDECDANAHLIASAPELLDALTRLVDIENGDVGAIGWESVMDAARAAILKATGVSNA